MDPSMPGWYPDPYGRHRHRYWSGVRWSRHVDDDGHRAEDPLEAEKLLRPVGHAPRRRHDTGPVPAFVPPARALTATRRPLPTPPRGQPRLSLPTPAEVQPKVRRDVPPRGRRGPLALVVAAVVGAVLALGAVVVISRSDGGDDELLSVVVETMHVRSNQTVTDVEAECMAEALIRSVGRDRLVQLGALDGVDPIPSLDTAERHLAVPRAFDCLDDQATLDLMVATWPAQAPAGLGPELAPCVYQGWWDGMGRETVVNLYASLMAPEPPRLDQTLDPEDFTIVADILSDCQVLAAG